MSEETNGVSDAPGDTVSDSSQESETSTSGAGNQVAYETYRKTLGEAKKAKNEVEEMRKRLGTLEEQKLEAEGNKDELITKLRDENNKLTDKLSGAVHNFAKSKIESAIIAEATKLGCQDANLLIRAYSDDVNGIDFDEKFSPDQDQVRALVDKIRGEKKFLFSKSAPQTANHQIKTHDGKLGEKKSLSKMKDDDLMTAWANSKR